MDALIVGARFLHYAALSLLFGAPLFRLAVVGAAEAQGGRRARRADRLAAGLALLSALGWLIGVAAEMSGSFAEALTPETLGAVLGETRFGQVWAARLVLAVALITWLSRRRSSGSADAVALALAGALTASLATVGHGAIGAGPFGPFHLAADAIHLLAAAAWLGGLFCLASLVARARRQGDAAALRRALPRFSRLAALAVALLAASGLVNAAILLPHPVALIASDYGRLLTVKLALALAMLALAAVNRLVLMPRILAGEERGLDALSRSVALEQAIGFAVLALVAWLGTLAPGR
jgi:putative copper resistance protein D